MHWGILILISVCIGIISCLVALYGVLNPDLNILDDKTIQASKDMGNIKFYLLVFILSIVKVAIPVIIVIDILVIIKLLICCL